MKLRKLTAIALVATFLLGVASCATKDTKKNSKKNKKDKEKIEKEEKDITKKYDKALSKAGFKKMDSDEDEDNYKDAQEDGFYIVITDKKLIDDLADNIGSDYADINSIVYAYREEGDNEFQVYVVDFKDKDAAQDCFDYLVDYENVDDSELDMYGEYGDVASINEDDLFQIAISVEVYRTTMTLYLDIAIDDNIVTYSRVMALDDDIEDYCDIYERFYNYMDVKSAADLI